MADFGWSKGFEQKRMAYTICRGCANFRALCFNENKGFACADGVGTDYYLPYNFCLLSKEEKKEAMLRYEKNLLPDECRWTVDCVMTGIMGDEDEIEELSNVQYDALEISAKRLDTSTDSIFEELLKLDIKFSDWCNDTPDATIAMLQQEGKVKAFACYNSEQDCDYSWIQPRPPEKDYFQKGVKRLAIRYIHSDGSISNAMRLLLGLAYSKAVRDKDDEIYAVVKEGVPCDLFVNGGFHPVGYKYGGDGTDMKQTGFFVVVKKLLDLYKKEWRTR